MIYVKNINEFNSLSFKRIQQEYNLASSSNLRCYIGNDNKIYILFNYYEVLPAFTENRVLRLSIDWNNGIVINKEILDFSLNFQDIVFIQPIRDNYLISGIYKNNDDIENENNKYKYITDIKGNIIRKIFLGWIYNRTCLVDSKNRIIVGYYDQAIIEDPRTQKGLIIYDEYGNKVWENEKYDIINCYALDIDTNNNIWFYPDNNIVKISDSYVYNIYNAGIKFSNGFLFNKEQTRFIFEKGYQEKNNFFIKDFTSSKFLNEQPCIFKCGSEVINIHGFTFRNSKAILWDESELYWFDWQDE